MHVAKDNATDVRTDYSTVSQYCYTVVAKPSKAEPRRPRGAGRAPRRGEVSVSSTYGIRFESELNESLSELQLMLQLGADMARDHARDGSTWSADCTFGGRVPLCPKE